MTDKTSEFRRLVKIHGSKKAAEIIRTTSNSMNEDFAKTHKKLDAFSNKTTGELIQLLEEENEIQTPSGKYGESIIMQSQFSLETTQSSEFVNTLYAE